MLRWTMIATLALVTAASAADLTRSEYGPAWALHAAKPGRTDGPEGSEYGKGGYGRFRGEGRFYIEGFLGSATVDSDDENGIGTSQTDLMAGLTAGYRVEDWLGFQLGYARIAEQNADFVSGGIRSSLGADPFNYYAGLDAEIYSPEAGARHFGIAPSIGAEIVLTDRIRAGLRFQRDIIFADESIDINRFAASLQFDF